MCLDYHGRDARQPWSHMRHSTPRRWRDSVDKLVSNGEQTAPQFEQGYANWKQANGGVFTVPVSKLPELLFKATGSTQITNQ